MRPGITSSTNNHLLRPHYKAVVNMTSQSVVRNGFLDPNTDLESSKDTSGREIKRQNVYDAVAGTSQSRKYFQHILTCE
jgi:hypothetical protein